MKRILGEMGALEERMIKLVHTIPNHLPTKMDFLPKALF